MKKLLAVVVALGMFGIASHAQGLENGSQMLTLSIAGAAGTEKTDTYFHNEEIAWGEAGVTFGLSYLVFPTKYFGMGVEVSDGIFAGDDITVHGSSWKDELETAMNVFNVMASFRFNFNPASRARFYIPFGAGLTSATGGWERTFNGVEMKRHSSTQSLGYFAGFGFEIGLGSEGKWSLGSELRYNAFQYDWGKLTGVGGKKDLGYVSASFKASRRF